MPASRSYDVHQVAKIIIQALEFGLPLSATVQEVMGVSPSKAELMLRAVRELGLLVHEQHEPARAVIHRNSKHQQGWLVCQYCKTPWPCTDFTNRETDTDEPPRKRGRP